MHKLARRSIPLILILSSWAIAAAAPVKPQTLTLNAPIERELTGDQKHSYTVNLKPDQIARLVVEQRGVDVVVAVISPEGKTLFEVDGPIGAQGEESATIVATKAGAYKVEIRTAEQSSSGRYEIRLDRFLSESEYTTEKLAALGRLWGTVKYFHPYLAYKDIDWDGALIKTIPRVKSAHTPNEYREAINAMLAVLEDPATTADLPSVATDSAAPPDEKKEPVFFRTADEVVIVSAMDWAYVFMTDRTAAMTKQPQLMQEIDKAKGVVIDCRGAGISDPSPFYLDLFLNNVIPSLVQGLVPLGTERYRVHNGYPPQRGNTSGGYTSSFVTDAPGAIPGRAQSTKPIVVILDEKTPDLIHLWSGLQWAGAKVLQVGKDDAFGGGRFHQVLLLDGVAVRMRVTEFVDPNGGSSFRADAQLPSDALTDEKVMSSATAMLNRVEKSSPASPVVASAAPALRSPKDAPYADMSFPSEEYRLLALFRFWNVIHYFYPYKHLTDRPWSTVLPDFIPRFMEDKSALDYEMTVAEMVARLQDSHGFVNGFKSLPAHLGTSAPPIGVGAVGGKLVVTGLPDQAVAEAAGLRLGDVIVAIDGQPAAERIAYLSKFRALSTAQSAESYIYRVALRGAPDSKVKLRVETADGQTREIEMTRTVPPERTAAALQRKTPIYEVLPSGYGYIDLGRLQAADAQKAMDAVMSTRALIFDMRGYPNATAWEIAPRLTEKTDVTAALFRRPLQSAADLAEADSEAVAPDLTFEQKLPPAKGAIYKGKVVMLINQDAISQAEHTCMFFEAATNVTFIGSPTNGANGDVTNLVLPGAIYVSFSGHDVRHADGRQLQRVGIQPTIRIDPTIAGIREGRDEVLEGAIKFLDQH